MKWATNQSIIADSKRFPKKEETFIYQVGNSRLKKIPKKGGNFYLSVGNRVTMKDIYCRASQGADLSGKSYAELWPR